MRITRATIAVLLAAGLAACSSRPVARPEVVYPAACTLLPARAAVDTLTMALDDGDGPAPLFRHLYETLVTVDCLGGVHPGLADAWDSDEEGLRWSFELYPEARFWDGSAVNAAAVVAGWRDTLARSTAIDSAVAVGERTVEVYLSRPRPDMPRLLAAPGFAVTAPAPDGGRPLGTGPYRPTASASAVPLVATPLDGRGPVLRVVTPDGGDPRDWLGGTADLVFTSDPGVLEYAGRRPQLAVLPLPWDTTYTLVSATRAGHLASGRLVGPIPDRLADGVVRDAVRSDARAYRPPSWWHDVAACGAERGTVTTPPPGPAYEPTRLRRILYDRQDPVARDLAERLAALAAMDAAAFPEAGLVTGAVPGMVGGPAPLRAEGVPWPELEAGLKRGDDFAYVVPVPARPADACAEAETLIQRIPWLGDAGSGPAEVLIPLVDTRPHVIATTGGVGLTVDWYGRLLLATESPER